MRVPSLTPHIDAARGQDQAQLRGACVASATARQPGLAATPRPAGETSYFPFPYNISIYSLFYFTLASP